MKSVFSLASGIAVFTAGAAFADPPKAKPTSHFVTQCTAAAAATAKTEPATADAEARRAAQRGLDFLGDQSVAWYQHNKCYGCHVHAVTLQAMSVGLHHQYRVSKDHLGVVLRAMLEPPDGAHGVHGLSHQNGSWTESAKQLGGAAFARYDDWVDAKVREELLTTARQLLEFQNADGSLRETTSGYRPVIAGPLQATYLALATWRQAYARSADDAWLAPIRRAETYVQKEARRLSHAPLTATQDVNYALMGLLAAGAGGSEDVVRSLATKLRSSQRDDGGFGFTAQDTPNPFATGQSLYALRLAGYTDADHTIVRGTRWLIGKQRENGGWSDAGFGKAEAMWGVLGLVSVDVLSVRIAGIEDGQHVSGVVELGAVASDNDKGGGVVKIELAIDDVTVFGECASKLSWRWDTKALVAGKHFVDVIATNARGKISKRRIEVYAGSIYMTELGSRFVDGGTSIVLRDIAPKTMAHRVRLAIHSVAEKDGLTTKNAPVFTTDQKGEQGPIAFHWAGKNSAGAAQPKGRYIAELSFIDDKGTAIQREELQIVHDTPEVQRASFADVQGEIGNEGGVPLANTKVELVDERGRVLQSAWTTDSGNYRFKNVGEGTYRVRVKGKKGYGDKEATVHAKRAQDNDANMSLHAH